MTTIVLVVLAIAWGAVLVFWLRSRSQDAAFSDSVGLFHRHLRVLERAAPSTLAAANRMRGADDGPIPLSSIAGGPARTLRPAPAGRLRQAGAGRPRPVASRPVGTSTYRRRQGQRRRRDVLFVLAILVVATLVLAVGVGSTAMVGAQVVSDLALGAYVALLVRLRNLAAEREMKLRVLHRPARPASPGGYAGYGDLALRRVAN